MTKYFVYIAGLKGPEPQIWNEDNKTVDGKKIKTLMQPILIGDDVGLDAARVMHPYPNEAKG